MINLGFGGSHKLRFSTDKPVARLACFFMEWSFLRHCELPFEQEKHAWSICPFSGSLLRSPLPSTNTSPVPLKVRDALKYCYDPYSCKSNLCELSTPASPSQTLKKIERMHGFLEHIGSGHFFISRCYASMRCELIENSVAAMNTIACLPSQKEYAHRLCLQRTLLVAKISKSFREKGVLFIGALLPTVEMHAWIIEDGCQPDAQDRQWILFRPLLALYSV